MSSEALDMYLKKRTRKICLVLISIILTSVVVAIAFDTAYYQSAEVKIYSNRRLHSTAHCDRIYLPVQAQNL